MIPVRYSPETRANKDLERLDALPGETNAAWVRRAKVRSGLVLLGGCDLVHFRLRVAQSHARGDLAPSYWSMVGVLRDDETIVSAPINAGDVAEVPLHNAVREERLADYADPERYPNVAVIAFPIRADEVERGIASVRAQRGIIDLPGLLVRWLAFLWGAEPAHNPLLAQQGIPCAAFVSAVHAIAGVDVTPGLGTTANCPEAIWQAARWWHSFYEKGAAAPAGGAGILSKAPVGAYCLRQPAAALTWARR